MKTLVLYSADRVSGSVTNYYVQVFHDFTGEYEVTARVPAFAAADSILTLGLSADGISGYHSSARGLGKNVILSFVPGTGAMAEGTFEVVSGLRGPIHIQWGVPDGAVNATGFKEHVIILELREKEQKNKGIAVK